MLWKKKRKDGSRLGLLRISIALLLLTANLSICVGCAKTSKEIRRCYGTKDEVIECLQNPMAKAEDWIAKPVEDE